MVGFNPRPSSLTGEPMVCVIFWCKTRWFQSTPVITDGRTATGCTMAASSVLFQSTPVITDGRTFSATDGVPPCAGFQSTPVITDGRTKDDGDHRNHHRRFQSTPVITDGRTRTSTEIYTTPVWFQSTPVITDGRTPVRRCGSQGRHNRFNPRPSSLTGEPTRSMPSPACPAVSIHARHH